MGVQRLNNSPAQLMNWMHQPLTALKFLPSLWRGLSVSPVLKLHNLSSGRQYFCRDSITRFQLLIFSLRSSKALGYFFAKKYKPWSFLEQKFASLISHWYPVAPILWLFMHTSTFCFSVESWFNIFEGLSYTINLDIGITNNIHKHHCYVHICTSSAAPSCLANGDEMHHSKHILTSEIIKHGSGGRVYTSELMEYSIWDINKFSFNLCKINISKDGRQKFLPSLGTHAAPPPRGEFTPPFHQRPAFTRRMWQSSQGPCWISQPSQGTASHKSSHSAPIHYSSRAKN